MVEPVSDTRSRACPEREDPPLPEVKTTVAHLMRTYLSPTETFIGNQIVTLQRYRPVVGCHARGENSSYPVEQICALQEALPPGRRMIDQLTYRARHLPGGSAARLADFAQMHSARLLHFHYVTDARFFLALKRLTDLPSVVSAYGYDVSSFPRKWRGYGTHYLRPIFRDLDLFVAMSHDMRRDLLQLGCPEEKIVVHYHGIDTDRFAFPERTYPNRSSVGILMCGTLEPKKAQDRVLEALRLWEQAHPGGPAFSVTLMGDGPLRARLERLVGAYGWQDRVRFLGHVPHRSEALLAEYRKADMFALPSVTVDGDKEGIPGSIVEAMACGLPVVATNHAGLSEVMRDGENGLLVDELDLEGLSRALGELIESRDLRERLGVAASRTAAAECRLADRTLELERIYDDLLAAP